MVIVLALSTKVEPAEEARIGGNQETFGSEERDHSKNGCELHREDMFFVGSVKRCK